MTGETHIDILLVDDDPDCLLMVKEAISQCRIQITIHEVSSGEEALDFLYSRGAHTDAPHVGLVYLDVEMPGLNGQDVLKIVRSDARFNHIPIVMLTGVADDDEKAVAANNGANSYTVKPTDPTEFARIVVATTSYWARVHSRPSGTAVPTS